VNSQINPAQVCIALPIITLTNFPSHFLRYDSWSRYRTFPISAYYIHPHLSTCANICAYVYFIDTCMGISSAKPLLTCHREYITTFVGTRLGLSQMGSLVDTVSYGPHNEWEGFGPYIFIVDVERARPTLVHHHIPWTLSILNNQLSSINHYPSSSLFIQFNLENRFWCKYFGNKFVCKNRCIIYVTCLGLKKVTPIRSYSPDVIPLSYQASYSQYISILYT
jgi:hypothetical protein